MSRTKLRKDEDTFAGRLRNLRLVRGWSQENLAMRLDVSNGSIGNWETGPTIPHPKMLRQLSTLFEVDINYLLRGSNEPPPPPRPAPSKRASMRNAPPQDVIEELLEALNRAIEEMLTIQRLARILKRPNSGRHVGKRDTGRKIAEIVRRDSESHLAGSNPPHAR
jgi:transcriptional regulator with XRE-family HTH domain